MESLSENEQNKQLIHKLKFVTGESESVCRTTLEENDWNYDLAYKNWYYSRTWFQTIWWLGWRVLNYWIGNSSEQNNSESNEVVHRKFISSLENLYGQTHPTFFEGTFVAACNRAKNDFKLLIVYLHSPQNPETESFCRDTLFSEIITEFFNANFLLWAGSIHSMEGYTVSNSLRASAYPFLAVVCHNTVGGVTPVFANEGFISVEDLMEKLTSVLEQHGNLLNNQKKEKLERDRDRFIREEQEIEYQKSLQEDQEKERRAREEQRKLEEEERKKKEADKRRQEITNKLTVEPSPGDKVTQLLLRLSDGSRVQRRFYKTDKLQLVYDFVDSKDTTGSGDYDLVTNFPVRKYDEKEKTLEELGLIPQASLFVQTR